VLVEAAEQRGVVDDVPDAIIDRFETDVLAVEGLAEVSVAAVDDEVASVAYPAHLEVAGILRGKDADGIGSR